MYMEHPFQIFQMRDAVAMTFEWQQVFRLIYTNGTGPSTPLPFWMGDSRGRWDGDTFVVDVTNHNDRTWFDMSGVVLALLPQAYCDSGGAAVALPWAM